MTPLSPRRLGALCRKEARQIVRDPTSILVAFVLPVILLFIFGFAIDLDADHVRIGLLREDPGPAAVRLEQTLCASRAFAVRRGFSRAELMADLARGRLRGVVVIRNDFTARWLRGEGPAVQVLADGSEPNTAAFVANYLQGALDAWREAEDRDRGGGPGPRIQPRTRTWFNPANVSRNFLVPGSIGVVMTIIGALLTSLVVAREWERGTMEALLATPVTRAELLLAKILPYYLLGMVAMALCLATATLVMGVPFRGSLLALAGITTLFLGSALGLGLFLSTALRSQFNAAMAALVAGFLPSLMLSGFVFEIASMPGWLQLLTRLIPARYLTHSLQSLFQAGTLPAVLLPDAGCLALLALFWLGLTARKTRRTLD